MQKKFIVTGGAGFIGSAVARKLIRDTPHHVLVVDKLTYAGNLDSLAPICADSRYRFEHSDICDGEGVRQTPVRLSARRHFAPRRRNPR